MDPVFRRFQKLGINLASVGVERRSADEPHYFCTPRGASVFGWAGVDGIHFCFIRGFGNMVFAVSPANSAPDYVHPLAENFEDFLRLLLACNDAAALEQAWMWDRAQFDAFLQENPPTAEQRAALQELAERLHLTPMEQPWESLRALQASFDYGKIRYTEDFEDPDLNPAAREKAPEWRVFFDGGFWGRSGRERAGQEQRLDVRFHWAERDWIVPAAYFCGRGLVLDLCMQVEPAALRTFSQKWQPELEHEPDAQTAQELERENPLNFDFWPELELNGRTLACAGMSVADSVPPWPGLPEQPGPEGTWAAEHYGLDPACCWVIFRASFPWATARRPVIRTLTLSLKKRPGQVPGPQISLHAPGDSVRFVSPVSGTAYTLAAQALERQMLPEDGFRPEGWFYPRHFTMLRYTITPEPEEPVALRDCDAGDRPLEIAPCSDAAGPTASNAAIIGIIGGADGPTVLMVGTAEPVGGHTVCSSLHFEPQEDDVCWRVLFTERPIQDGRVLLTGK